MDKKSGLKRLGYSIYTPLPGSDLAKQYEGKNIENDLTKFDYIHTVVRPTKMSIRKFYYYYYKLVIKSFLLVKKYGTYDYIDINKWIKEFFKQIFKKK